MSLSDNSNNRSHQIVTCSHSNYLRETQYLGNSLIFAVSASSDSKMLEIVTQIKNADLSFFRTLVQKVFERLE